MYRARFQVSPGEVDENFRDNLSVSSSRFNNIWVPIRVESCRWDRQIVTKRRQGITPTRRVITQKNAVLTKIRVI